MGTHITFPTTLDSLFGNELAHDTNGEHVVEALQEAVDALEAKVGADSSAVATAHDYILANDVVKKASAGLVSVAHTLTNSAAAGAIAARLGGSATEGLEVRVMEEDVDLTDAGAKYVAMSNALPSGAVILSVQANIETLVEAGGTTVKVGIGVQDGDMDEYGLSGDLLQNTKIDTIPDWAVLAAEKTLHVCGCTTDGSALGDTNLSAGLVRVRIVYLALNSLDDAA